MAVSLRHALLAACLLPGPCGLLPAQDPKPAPAYPEQDILSPFRSCEEIQAPPDAAFRLLRAMRAAAEDRNAIRSFDPEGREIVDDERWRNTRAELDRLGLDAGHLALILRKSRNGDERDLAFLGAFYCESVDDIFNLISHIPGEPSRAIREKAYPRAVAFLRAHIGRRFGDLSPEQQLALAQQLPAPGSPAAKARGITRAPRPEDPLHHLNLKPFFQLLDLDDAADQAQGLWFLKECFRMRLDLAGQWLEPALPRVRQLLVAEAPAVRREALGVFAAIAPPDLETPAEDAGSATLLEFAAAAERHLFPPLRQIGEGLLLLFPSPERNAIAAAGRAALSDSTITAPASGRTRDGQPYRGLRLVRVPDELATLRLAVGSVITAVNGTPVNDAAQLLRLLESQFEVRDAQGRPRPISRRSLLVEYCLDGVVRAIEYRVM